MIDDTTRPQRVLLAVPLYDDHGDEVLTAQCVRYADACLYDSIRRGEAPIALQLLYPRVLDCSRDAARRAVAENVVAWLAVSERVVLYRDLGVSDAMWGTRQLALAADIPVEHRSIGSAGFERDVHPTPGFLIRAGGARP